MPTLTPNKDDQDEKLNPSQRDYLRSLEQELGKDKGIQSADNDHKAFSDSSAQAKEGESRAVSDTSAGKAAISAASTAAVAGGPVGTVAATAIKLIGKIKTKKGGVGAAIIGIVLALVIIGLGFFGPGLLIVQVKEALTEKFNDVATAISDRNTLIVQKRISDSTTGCGTIKVKCRYKGMSDRQIARIERTGVTVDKGTQNPLTKRWTINKLVTPDGTEVRADNYKLVIRDNAIVRGYMNRAFNSKYTAYTTKAFDALSRKIGIDKRKKLVGNNPDSIRESFSNSIGGVDENGNRIGRLTLEDGYTQDEVDKANADIQAFEDERARIASSGKRAALSVAKSGALTALTAGVGVVDGVCTGYYLIQLVGYGAKVVASEQLIRFAFTYANTADAIKAGDVTPEEVEFLGNNMTSLNKNGESFTDSFGYKYAALDSLALPVGVNSDDTQLRRGEIFQYAAGGGLGGALINFTSMINQYTGGAPKEVCGVVKNPFTQIGLLIGGIALTVFSGGTSLGPGTAAAIGLTATLGVLVALAVPTLQNIAAGKIVTNETAGGDAGNAVVSGMGALNARNAQAHGLSPQTKAQAVAYQNYSKERENLDKVAAANLSSPFDISDTASVSNNVLTTLSTSVLALKQKPISSTSDVLSKGVSTLFNSNTARAAYDEDQYDICTDADYVEKDYAADPFCNVRYGLSSSELNADPETVVDQMLAAGHIDDEGKPSSGEFQEYINSCINRIDPLGSAGPEGQGNDGAICNNQEPQYQNFRVYYLDTVINDTFEDEDTLSLGTPAPTIVAPPPGDTGDLKGQYQNGRIPAEALCQLGPDYPDREMLRCDAQKAFVTMNEAYRARFGKNISVTDSYRSFEDQVRVKAEKGRLAATPGTSEHGWGQALDLGGGINRFGTAEHNWMKDNAPQYGWNHPSWARQGGNKEEPWHWEYGT